jgi:hypothetical protein
MTHCYICFESDEKVKKICCKHAHKECLGQWIKSTPVAQNHVQCEICRKEYPMKLNRWVLTSVLIVKYFLPLLMSIMGSVGAAMTITVMGFSTFRKDIVLYVSIGSWIVIVSMHGFHKYVEQLEHFHYSVLLFPLAFFVFFPFGVYSFCTSLRNEFSKNKEYAEPLLLF